jgi:hypothetical protein
MSTEEKMVLGHEPVPGYRTALYVAITIGLSYLAIAFFL